MTRSTAAAERLRRDLILVSDATLGPGELELLASTGWADELLRRRSVRSLRGLDLRRRADR